MRTADCAPCGDRYSMYCTCQLLPLPSSHYCQSIQVMHILTACVIGNGQWIHEGHGSGFVQRHWSAFTRSRACAGAGTDSLVIVTHCLHIQGPRNLYSRDGEFHPTFKSRTEKRLFSIQLLMTLCPPERIKLHRFAPILSKISHGNISGHPNSPDSSPLA